MRKVFTIILLGFGLTGMGFAEKKDGDLPSFYKKIDPRIASSKDPKLEKVIKRLANGTPQERHDAISWIVKQKPLSKQYFNLLVSSALNDEDKKVREYAVWRISMCGKEHLSTTIRQLLSLYNSTNEQNKKMISTLLAMASMHPNIEEMVEMDQKLYEQLKPEIVRNRKYYDILKLFEIREALNLYKNSMNGLPANLSELVKKGYLKDTSLLTSRVSKQQVTMDMLDNNAGDFLYVPQQALTEKLANNLSAAPLVITKPGIYGDSRGRILTHGGYIVTFHGYRFLAELHKIDFLSKDHLPEKKVR